MLCCFLPYSNVKLKLKVTQSCPTLFNPWTIQPMEFSRPEYWSGQPLPSPGDLPNPGIKPRSPAFQEDSLPAEPQGKPKNTGVDSLSLLQQIFLIQEFNQGLLHCRWILYQLSYEGSPKKMKVVHFLFATVSHSAICSLLQLHSKHKMGHW